MDINLCYHPTNNGNSRCGFKLKLRDGIDRCRFYDHKRIVNLSYPLPTNICLHKSKGPHPFCFKIDCRDQNHFEGNKDKHMSLWNQEIEEPSSFDSYDSSDNSGESFYDDSEDDDFPSINSQKSNSESSDSNENSHESNSDSDDDDDDNLHDDDMDVINPLD
jgi:hypothetical protein